ncbi:MAG: glycosyltransferase family 2 protein [Candidatus Margulisbacteria bacterium]|nr:glycosyltransferase family 2 protein [Candidatus Margulisiibacteriota bacterium]
MKTVNVSVIIVHYNTPELLTDCLKSLYEYTKDVTFEVIIVDNNSKNKPDKNLKQYPDLTFINNKENYGFAKANNMAVVQAKGQYLLFLNSDTLLIENSLKKCMKYLDENPQTGILGPRLLNTDKTTQYYGSIINHWRYWGKKPRKVGFISGAAMFIKKDLFQKIGGFDEHYFFYNEDVDLCKTVNKTGLNVIYFPGTSIVHLGGKSTTRSHMLRKQVYKSSWYFFKKHYLKLTPPHTGRTTDPLRKRKK